MDSLTTSARDAGSRHHNASRTVSVIIPLFGPPSPNVELLLTQLMAENVREVTVVVSGASALPPVPFGRILSCQRRLLPAPAKNRGAYSSCGDNLLFIDADNTIQPGLVSQLTTALDDPAICVAGAATHFQSAPERVAFFGATHRHWTGRTVFHSRPAGAHETVAHRVSSPMVMDVVANAYMMRRDTFEAIGGFDEVAFPTHYEESDLVYRAREYHGGQVVCIPSAIVYNDMPLDPHRRLVAKDPLRSYYTGRNRPIFIARHLSARDWLVYLLFGQFVFAAAYGRAEFSSRHERWREAWPSVRAYVAGMRDGYFYAAREMRLREGRRSRRGPDA